MAPGLAYFRPLNHALVALLAAMDNGTLADTNISFFDKKAATVVAVSGGYPGAYAKNIPITGWELAPKHPQTLVFHAGTAQANEGLVTAGGRVVAVTSFGDTLGEAVQHAVATLEQIQFEGMYYRKDIGYEF
jgi:phosphoribosylamine--glycine ligase